jgi:hypothetical protein
VPGIIGPLTKLRRIAVSSNWVFFRSAAVWDASSSSEMRGRQRNRHASGTFASDSYRE